MHYKWMLLFDKMLTWTKGMATDDAKIVGSILVFLALALLFVYLFLEKKYESFERDQLRSDEGVLYY